MPSHLARIDPSGFRVAPETRLQSGKLYLMIFVATAAELPFGAAPTAGLAASAGQAVASSADVTMAVTDADLIEFPISVRER